MMAISIKQPFVEQILQGVKRREYRSTRTHVRGRVYLYASLKGRPEMREWRKVGRAPGSLRTGVIVGTVEIVGCKELPSGEFAYLLENPKRLLRPRKVKNQPQPVFWHPVF
ncbi:MAG: ASCH domain-containing protein [Myxococcales bacterium]|nr:ASCH domain-containing protein [Myxococcales bacterium]